MQKRPTQRLARTRTFFGAAAIVLLTAPGLHAQQATLSGVVVESERGATVAGATLRLNGRPPFSTDLDGGFRFAELPAGTHTLVVEALGYRPRTVELELSADTAVRIVLTPAPLELDSLVVSARNVTVRGTMRDAATTVPVMIGQVTLYPGGRLIGANTGRFTLDRVPAGQPVTLVFEALEYLPVTVSLVLESDTTLSIPLAVDSVALRMVAQQVERLAERAQAVPFTLTALNRDDLMRHVAHDVLEAIRRAVPGSSLPSARRDTWGRGFMSGCYFLDDSKVTLDRIQSLIPEDVERVEVFGRGSMVRVYTRRYVHRLMGESELARTGHITGLGSPFCN